MDKFEEDYLTWSDGTGRHRHSYGHRTEADPKTTAAEETVLGGVGSDPGAGTDQKRPHFMDGRDNYYSDRTHRTKNQADGCHFKMEDCPEFKVSVPGEFSVTWRFKGEIWDVCYDRIADGPKYFTVTITGTAAFGQVAASYDAYRSDADGNRGEPLASGDILAYPGGVLGPGGYRPPSEQRSGSDYDGR